MPTSCPTCFSAYAAPSIFARQAGRLNGCAHCRAMEERQDGRGTVPSRYDALEIVAEARSARRRAPIAARREAAQRRENRAKPRGGLLRWAMVVGLVALGMTGVAQKEDLVRLYPPSASLFDAMGLPVNLRGLALADLHGSITAQASGAVLSLEGRIRNLRRQAVSVPTLRIAVRNKASVELYSWTVPAPKPKLDAGETVLFRSRLAAPPEEGQNLIVSFADPIGAPRPHTEPP